ncbi:hypothetical protein [Methylobacterium sp. ARG-1]|uniref:hypothetical protein n=1 Tax=Methylobacterium sp. ARG-1 TaxID=1692501 RepID=UPI000AE3409D|nr:hypothetical protein [Methylobacterium sp. ARG-1]
MATPKKPDTDPNKVVTREDGTQVRPGRFSSDGEGMTITQPGEEEPDYDDEHDPDDED